MLIAVATCEIDAFPTQLLELFAKHKAQMFCLPDFVEERELWPEFIAYLDETRQIAEVIYGQNPIFLEMLPALSAHVPNRVFTYIPRYWQRDEAVSL